MTRSELIRRLADANPAPHQSYIVQAVEVLFSEIAAGLARGERVELRGFGNFTLRRRRARRARNPATGGAVEVGKRNYLVFHAGKPLHDCLNPVPGKSARRAAKGPAAKG